MFLLKLLRYIRGYVQFYVQGVFVERFLNLAARDRIPIWDGRKRGDTFTGKTLAGSYHKLRRHAKKTGVKMRVCEKRGAPFKRRKFRRRKGLLIGFLIFCAFVFLTSRFIWRVEINGNVDVSESDIASALDILGVSPGTLRSSIDVRGVERRALLALEDLSWIALNIRGSTVHVEVRESTPPPPMVDPHKPCNVVASMSGQIVSMMVFDGQPTATVGDSVLKGDVLASGITQDRLGQNLFKHAGARVMAKVQHRITVETPLEQTEFIETGTVRNKAYLRVFNWDLPLFWPSKIPRPYRVERNLSNLFVFGVELPVGIFSEKYILMQEQPVLYTETEAKQLALKELALRQKVELGDAEILDKAVLGTLKDGVFILDADLVCLMDIALEKEIFKTESE